MNANEQCYFKFLDTLEQELEQGRIISNEGDVKFLKVIINSFHRIWKLNRRYPSLSSILPMSLFRSIFNDLLCAFQSTVAKLDFKCGVCDAEFPCLNNDEEFSFQMHEQTPEHVAVLNDYKMFHSVDPFPPVVPNNVNVTAGNSASSFHDSIEITFEDDVWIVVEEYERLKYCLLCNVKYQNVEKLKDHVRGHVHQENLRRSPEYKFVDKDQWILDHRNGQYACVLCKAALSVSSLGAHVNGKIHKKKLIQKNDPVVKERQQRLIDAVKVTGGYASDSSSSSNFSSDLSYAFQSTGSKLNFECGIYNTEFPYLNNNEEFSFQMHKQTPKLIEVMNNDGIFNLADHFPFIGAVPNNVHKAAGEPTSSIHASIQATFEDDVWIVVEEDERLKYCLLCNVKYQNIEKLRDHVQGHVHQENLRRSPEYKFVDKDQWILDHRNGQYACVLCKAALSVSSLGAHVNGQTHRKKLNQKNDPVVKQRQQRLLDTMRKSAGYPSVSNNVRRQNDQPKILNMSKLTSGIPTSGKAASECDEWIIVDKDKKWQYCFLCDVKYRNAEKLRNHTVGFLHQEYLLHRAEFKFVDQNECILDPKNGMHYVCVLCKAAVPVSSLVDHVNGPEHKGGLTSKRSRVI